MTTVETALSLATLVAVAAAIVGGIATMSAYIAAVDTAGAAARAYALGVDYAAPRGEGGRGVDEQAGGTADVDDPVDGERRISATDRLAGEHRRDVAVQEYRNAGFDGREHTELDVVVLLPHPSRAR